MRRKRHVGFKSDVANVDSSTENELAAPELPLQDYYRIIDR